MALSYSDLASRLSRLRTALEGSSPSYSTR